jgi:segregation and condensation protein A
VDLAEEIDPRYELVQQLLEYKRLKDSTRVLEDRAEGFARTVGRPETARPEPMRVEDRSIEEVGIFDLLSAFQRILDSLGPETSRSERHVRIDDKPVRVYAQELRERLSDKGSMLFSEIVGGRPTRQETIGWFLALLLLLKKELVTVAQGDQFGDIRIGFRSDTEAPTDLELEDDFR